VTQLVEDDPESDGPYMNELLRFTNVGPETALMVRIEPIIIGDREISLWDSVDLIKSGDHEDVLSRGSLSAAFQHLQKLHGFDFRKEVRVPLVARYTDRNRGDWSTPHMVVFQGYDVRIEPITSVKDVVWTDIAGL
jgi:hypothetical protein